jgi:hypothetical protein
VAGEERVAFEYRLDLMERGWSIVHEPCDDERAALHTAQTAADTTGVRIRIWRRPVGGRDVDWVAFAERSPST